MKVFGTGMQRTGTTSLAQALDLLGIKTRDCPKDLWGNLDHEVLQRYDGFTDNPIPLLYRDLDRKLPGSKFVHTVRDEQRWLESVEWLFTTGALKFAWDRHPHFHEFHRALYGRTDFDAATFLERYRRHNREVLDYFADRPADLLVMDLTAGDGFDRLCPFLGREVPAAPFPHRNRHEWGWKVKVRQGLHRLLRGER